MSDVNDFEVPAGQAVGELSFPPSWQGLRQQIVYLAQFGNSIQVIHAGEGGGKTSFFRHLCATGLDSTTVGVTVAKDAGLVIFFGDMLRELGLRPDPQATLGELAVSLRSYVQTLHKERSRAVLLVDDAHHLTDSELGALVSALQGQADAGVGLHVVLFAEPGLAVRIDALQVLDVAVHDAPLPAFSVAEMHQLLRAHQGDSTQVTAEQAHHIWYQSKGLPGAALAMLEHLRPPPPVAEKIMSLRGLPLAHIAALLVLCGVLIWAFLVRKVDDSPQNEALSGHLEPVQPVVIPIDAAARPSLARALETREVPEEPEITGRSIPDGAQLNPDAPPFSAEDLNVGANLDKHIDSEVVTVDDKVGAQIASNQEAAPVVKPASTAPMPKTTPAPALVSQTLVEAGAAKMLSLPANGYVLQLMAASAEDKLSAYVAEQPNKANLYAYKTDRGGKALYILVEGYYADKTSAQAAVVNLPQQQQKNGPWPKKIEQIHRELRKTQ